MRQLWLAAAIGFGTAAIGACGGGETVIDAAVDGTGGDGGVEEIDAREIDGGGAIDAGESDAGEIDAGEIDAGAIDAGEVDAGAIDAGAIDAGAIDASATDASAIDAAEIDAGAIDAPDVDAVTDATVDASVPVTFYWADWTAAAAGVPGSAMGTFDPPSGTVTIGYTGAVAFAQTSGGTNYWVPGAPYVNTVTANAPGHADIIAINAYAGTNTVTFDPPVTGLVLGVVSLGAPGNTVRYDFDRPIVLLSYGAGYWGNGTLLIENGDTLAGTEGHGAIQFPGTVSTLTWTVIGGEYWHGFTLGIPAQ